MKKLVKIKPNELEVINQLLRNSNNKIFRVLESINNVLENEDNRFINKYEFLNSMSIVDIVAVIEGDYELEYTTLDKIKESLNELIIKSKIRIEEFEKKEDLKKVNVEKGYIYGLKEALCIIKEKGDVK